MLQLKQLQDIKENEKVRKQRRTNQIKQNSIIKNKIAMIQQNNINMINKMVSIAEAEKAGRMKDVAQAEEVSSPFAQVINKMSVEQPKSMADSSMFHQFAQVANKQFI
jgi:hypothetical protein